jgi:hypothetical protein
LNRLLIVICTFYSTQLLSYPYFYSSNYQQCITCHYNPFGGSLVTPYGKSVYKEHFATSIFTSKESDETKYKRIDFSAKVRLLNYTKNFNRSETKENKFIPMQANLGVGYSSADKKVFFSQVFSYQPVQDNKKVEGREYENYRMRESNFIWKPNSKFLISAGLQDKPFGLRVADHSSFARFLTNNSYNDQSHGLVSRFSFAKSQLSIGYFLGNLVQEKELRQEGGLLRYSYFSNSSLKSSLSLWASKSKFVEESAISIDFIVPSNFGSLIGEFGTTQKNAITIIKKEIDSYLYLAGRSLLNKGYYLRVGFEVRQNETTSDLDFKKTIGIEINHRHNSQLEFRLDAKKGYGDKTTSPEFWDLLVLYHFWL